MRSCRRATIFFFTKTCISMTPIDSFSLKFDQFQFGLLRNGFVRQMYFWNVFKSHYSKIIHNWWLYLRPNRISGGRPPFTVLLCADVVDDDPFNSMQRLWTRMKRKRRNKHTRNNPFGASQEIYPIWPDQRRHCFTAEKLFVRCQFDYVYWPIVDIPRCTSVWWSKKPLQRLIG